MKGIYRKIFINSILRRGRGFAAILLFKEILFEIKLKNKGKALNILYRAMKKIPPHFFLRKLTLGGKVYPVPVRIFTKRQILLSAMWVLELAKKSEIKNFSAEAATILLEATKGVGPAMEKRKEWHKVGLENRMYVRFLR